MRREGIQTDMNRREVLAVIACAVSVRSGQAADDTSSQVVTLSAESEALIQRLIVRGYHKTREEVVNAAMTALMASG